jgi:hypothetical protein
MGWISARAHADRRPFRLTITVTVGELPAGWTKERRSMAVRTAIGVLGVILVAPFALAVAAAALRSAGLTQPFDWVGSSPAAITAATISLVIGLPVAFLLNVWPITRAGLRRHAGELEGLLAFELAPLQLVVVIVAVLIGGLFVGHLAADAYACLKGVHSAC